MKFSISSSRFLLLCLLLMAAGANLKYTESPGVGHNFRGLMLGKHAASGCLPGIWNLESNKQ